MRKSQMIFHIKDFLIDIEIQKGTTSRSSKGFSNFFNSWGRQYDNAWFRLIFLYMIKCQSHIWHSKNVLFKMKFNFSSSELYAIFFKWFVNHNKKRFIAAIFLYILWPVFILIIKIWITQWIFLQCK